MRKKFSYQWPQNKALVMFITRNLWNLKLLYFSLKLNLTSSHNNIENLSGKKVIMKKTGGICSVILRYC